MLTKEKRRELRCLVEAATAEALNGGRVTLSEPTVAAITTLLDAAPALFDSLDEMECRAIQAVAAFHSATRQRDAMREAFDRTIAGERAHSDHLCAALNEAAEMAAGTPAVFAIRLHVYKAIQKLVPPSGAGVALARAERERDEWRACAEATGQMAWRARLGDRVLALFADIATATAMTRGMDASGLLVERQPRRGDDEQNFGSDGSGG